jgi:acyl carrier protein
MERNEISDKVTEVFRDVLGDENLIIQENFSANDVDGWDSLTHIMLVVGIEKKFELKFLSSEILSWKDIGEMISSIKSKL